MGLQYADLPTQSKEDAYDQLRPLATDKVQENDVKQAGKADEWRKEGMNEWIMNAVVLGHKFIIHIIAKPIATGATCFERPATRNPSSSGISIFITEEGSTGL